MSGAPRSVMLPLVFALLCTMAPVAALADGTPPVAGSTGPASASVPPPQPPLPDIQCDKPSAPHVALHAPVTVSVNGATAWQPRGGTVLIAVTGDAASLTGLTFKACFSWSTAQADAYFTAQNLAQFKREAFVTVRPPDGANTVGLLNLGITVPNLDAAPTSIAKRIFESLPYFGFGLVPVADLRLIAYTNAGVVFDEIRPIGITSIFLALTNVALTLVLAMVCLYYWTIDRAPAKPNNFKNIMDSMRFGVSLRWMLSLTAMPNGRASLSGFQVLLWTLVVVGSAVYVMSLSGNLINVPTGMLTLLGIAGAAGLLASFSTMTTTEVAAAQAAAAQAATQAATARAAAIQPEIQGNPAQVAAAQAVAQAAANQTAIAQAVARAAIAATQRGSIQRETRWRDLIVDPEDGMPNISRIQMLLFTVVSAVFVVMQVVNYYVIPDIPAGYQILVGISNGLYVGRKFTPTS